AGAQVEPQLMTEDAAGPGPRAIGLGGAVLQHVAEQVLVDGADGGERGAHPPMVSERPPRLPRRQSKPGAGSSGRRGRSEGRGSGLGRAQPAAGCGSMPRVWWATWILRGLASSATGMVKVSTPSA